MQTHGESRAGFKAGGGGGYSKKFQTWCFSFCTFCYFLPIHLRRSTNMVYEGLLIAKTTVLLQGHPEPSFLLLLDI